MLTVSYDPSANLKRLRKLELDGLISIAAVNIESIQNTKKINRKEIPIAVIDVSWSRIDECVIAPDDTPFPKIIEIIGRQHAADALHFERHVAARRDVFVTDDTDFLKVRDELMKEYSTRIMTVKELEEHLSSE